MKKINIITLGCSKNTYDSELLTGGLIKNKFKIVKDPIDADFVIVNTCGFLDEAREESIEKILDIEELRKNRIIESLIVAGCMPERFEGELKKELKYVDHYFGSDQSSDIIEYLCSETHAQYDPDFTRLLSTPSHYAYLKIAEGCDNGCSFCSIPMMRGLQKSQPVEWNYQEAERLVKTGVREIMIIAQDSTSYGWDLTPKTNLSELLTRLDKIKDLEWIRLHYAHPAHLHESAITCFKNLERLIPYIDMPIQHASDKILTNMRRGLKIDGIKRKIEGLRSQTPDMTLRTSLIVGFPDETDEDFKLLYEFIKEIEFDRLGVFLYSEEEGTYGAKAFKDNIPSEVKKERFDALMSLQNKVSLSKNKNLIDTTQKVLIDAHTQEGFSIGRTFRDSPGIDNTVTFNSKLSIGDFYNAKIVNASHYSLEGEVSNE